MKSRNSSQNKEGSPFSQQKLSQPFQILCDPNTFPVKLGSSLVQFPYEPYNIQKFIMKDVFWALEKRQNALIEAPTGTGKSLAILCPLLAWLFQQQSYAPTLEKSAFSNISNAIHIKCKTRKRFTQNQHRFQNVLKTNPNHLLSQIFEIEKDFFLDPVNKVLVLGSQNEDADDEEIHIGNVHHLSELKAKNKQIHFKHQITPSIQQNSPFALIQETKFKENTNHASNLLGKTIQLENSPFKQKHKQLIQKSAIPFQNIARRKIVLPPLKHQIQSPRKRIKIDHSSVKKNTQPVDDTLLTIEIEVKFDFIFIPSTTGWNQASLFKNHYGYLYRLFQELIDDIPSCSFEIEDQSIDSFIISPNLLSKNQNISMKCIINDDFLKQQPRIPGLNKLTKMSSSSSCTAAQTPTIYYAMKTHNQIQQMISELEKTIYRPTNSFLAGKAHLCTHKPLVGHENLNLLCNQVTQLSFSSSSSSPTNQSIPPCGRRRSSPDTARKLSKLSNQIISKQKVFDLSEETSGCPYYALRSMVQYAQILFVPYQYLLSPHIRRSVGIDLENSVVVFDEGHNLPDQLRQSFGAEFDKLHINLAIQNVNQCIQMISKEQDFGLLLKCLSLMKHLFHVENRRQGASESNDSPVQIQYIPIDFQKDIEISFSLDSINMLYKEFKQQVLSSENIVVKGAHRNAQCIDFYPITDQILQQCVQTLPYVVSNPDSFTIFLECTRGKHKPNTKLIFRCLDPGLSFRDFQSQCRSIIIHSATLAPMDMFEVELGINFPIKRSLNHVCPIENTFCRIIYRGSSGAELSSKHSLQGQLKAMLDDLGRCLVESVQHIPNGMLVFVSSYSFLQRLRLYFNQNDISKRIGVYKRVFFESKNTQIFEKQMQAYKTSCETTGAILFAVARGKASEGIDFSGNLCRATYCIGIPFPNFKDYAIRKRLDWISKKFSPKIARNLFISQGFHDLNQSLGRTIRSKSDFGAICLFESRLEQPHYVAKLAQWVRPRFKVVPRLSTKFYLELEEFFKNFEAS